MFTTQATAIRTQNRRSSSVLLFDSVSMLLIYWGLQRLLGALVPPPLYFALQNVCEHEQSAHLLNRRALERHRVGVL
jgi:hypothetical protein